MKPKIDSLGRLLIPKQIRCRLNINPKDKIEFWVDGDKIILKKHIPQCVFCGSTRNVEKNICLKCKKSIVELYHSS